MCGKYVYNASTPTGETQGYHKDSDFRCDTSTSQYTRQEGAKLSAASIASNIANWSNFLNTANLQHIRRAHSTAMILGKNWIVQLDLIPCS